MKEKICVGLLIFIILLSMISFKSQVNAEGESTFITTNFYYDYDAAYEVLDLVNAERAKENLPALKMDKELLEVAMQRANELVIYFEHYRPNGEVCFSIFPNGFSAGENIAFGYNSPTYVMQGWMNSEGHRANIMDNTYNYDSIGIGAVKVQGTYFWVQCFETRNNFLNETTEKSNGTKSKEIEISSGILSTLNVKFSNLTENISMNKGETTKNAVSLKVDIPINNSSYKMNNIDISLSEKTNVWTTSNSNVCTVDYDGNITAVAPGSATVTFSLGNATKQCTVNVYSPLKSISLDTTSSELNKGDTKQLTVTYNPEDTTDDKTVTWTSSNSNVATVDNNGKVTATGAGTATITAKVGAFSASCEVTVKVPLTGISFSKLQEEKYVGKQTVAQSVIYNPEDTTDDKTVTWTSSDTNVATIDETGKIECKNIGTTVITAKVGTFTANYTLNVKEIPPYTLGDVNEDGAINIKDVKLALQYSLHKVDLTETQILAADVDVNETVDIKDVKKILQYSLKKINEF